MTKRTIAVLASGLIHVEKRTTQRVVTRPQGSWKWQNAFGISTYVATVSRRGKIIYKSIHQSARKYSEPQLRRWLGDQMPEKGSAHNREV